MAELRGWDAMFLYAIGPCQGHAIGVERIQKFGRGRSTFVDVIELVCGEPWDV